MVYVSAAAGGVGLLAAQLFQLRNATRVIGSAGTDEKARRPRCRAPTERGGEGEGGPSCRQVRLLRSKYGIEAFYYRRQAVGDALATLAPEGVDVFFDGGRPFPRAAPERGSTDAPPPLSRPAAARRPPPAARRPGHRLCRRGQASAGARSTRRCYT